MRSRERLFASNPGTGNEQGRGSNVSSPTQAHRASAAKATEELFDAVVIGTGFGGAVTACRLAQAGKNVCILERGRRYGRGDFPRPAERADHLPDTARWAWALDHGLFDAKDLQGALAVQAAGYGGGSLIYANVHLRPSPEVSRRRRRMDPRRTAGPLAIRDRNSIPITMSSPRTSVFVQSRQRRRPLPA